MPGQPPDNPAMRRLLDLRGGTGRRSMLYLWMRDHREALAADIARNGAQWAERVKLMGEAGLLDRTGKPPTIRGAMQTWYRVCRDAARAGAAPAAAAPSSPPAPGGSVAPSRPLDPPPQAPRRAPILPGVAGLAAAASGGGAEGPRAPDAQAEPDNPYGFRTAGGAKDWTQKGPR